MNNIENESFSEVLKKAIDKQEYILFKNEDSIYRNVGEAYRMGLTEEPLMELLAIKNAYKILESFEIYGDFLNPIPYEDKKKVINELILPWINRYSTKDIIIEGIKETVPIENEANKEIKKNIGTIERFEAMLLDKFSCLPIDLARVEDKDLDITIRLNLSLYEKDTLYLIQDLLKTTEDLKNDLKNRNFKIFPKYKYYYPKPETKQTLKYILDQLIFHYNLKSHNPYKKQLIDYI